MAGKSLRSEKARLVSAANTKAKSCHASTLKPTSRVAGFHIGLSVPNYRTPQVAAAMHLRRPRPGWNLTGDGSWWRSAWPSGRRRGAPSPRPDPRATRARRLASTVRAAAAARRVRT